MAASLDWASFPFADRPNNEAGVEVCKFFLAFAKFKRSVTKYKQVSDKNCPTWQVSPSGLASTYTVVS